MHPKLIKLEKKFNESILTKVDDDRLEPYCVELWFKRDDLIHPVISGNKWRKLKYILDHALALDVKKIISMGGAFSNHLHALAYVGSRLGLETVGLIRGEPQLNSALEDMQRWGMRLDFVTRGEYRALRQYKHWRALPGIGPEAFWLAEGGASVGALQGVSELVAEIDRIFDVICVPCGTGTTLAGIIEAVRPESEILGFAALKRAGFLHRDVGRLLTTSHDNWRINYDYHFGGFAKAGPDLIDFIEAFTEITAIPLEPVYTGKMVYGIYDLIKKGAFKPGQKILAVHTGGLQGNRGYR